MSFVGSNILAGASGQGGGGYEIERSLRFNAGDSAYLNRTPSSAGNRKTWTWSAWVKRSSNTQTALLHAGSSNQTILWFDGNHLEWTYYAGGYGARLRSSALFRDFSAWMHVVFVLDTTQATADNRMRLYVNGVELTDFAARTNPSQNADYNVNNTVAHEVGRNNVAGGYNFNGYLADIHFIDGQALAPTDFGEFDDDNVWQPKLFTGDYSGGPIYSNGTLSASPAQGNIQNIFDSNIHPQQSLSGSGGNQFYIYNQSAITYTFPQPLSGTFKIYAGNGDWNGSTSSSGGTVSLNTGASLTLPSTSVATDYFTIGAGTNVTSITFNPTNGGILMGAIYVDNVQLIDTTVGRNSFHLDFKDNSSNAALGTDTSGNSNTWTVNNLTANSRVYSNSITTTGNSGSWYPTYPATNIFDANTTNYGHANGDGSATCVVTFSLNPAITSTTNVSLYGGMSGSGTAEISINGGTAVALTSGSSATTETTVAFSGSISSIVITKTSTGAEGLLIYGFKIDGTRLTDGDLSSIDSLVDSPTNGTQTDTGAGGEVVGNYATWNPLVQSSSTFSNGNLQVTTNGGSGYPLELANFYTPAGTGAWYWEFEIDAFSGTPNSTLVGMLPRDSDYQQGANNIPAEKGGISVYVGYNGSISAASGAATAGTATATFAVGDILGWAFDAENGTLQCYKNGVSQGTQFTNIRTDIGWVFCVTDYDNSATATYVINFGQRPFAYPRSGHKCLNTASLPEPTIADGSKYFDTVLWSGNGGGAVTVPGLNLNNAPGFVWSKTRNHAYHNNLWDIVRGFGSVNALMSDLNYAEGGANGGTLNSATSSSLTFSGGVWHNENSKTYVAWNWDAGSSNTTIAAGSIRAASTVTAGNAYSAGWAGSTSGTWANTDSWSGLSAVSGTAKGYFSSTETLSDGSVISVANGSFGAGSAGSNGWVLRAYTNCTLSLTVYPNITEIAVTTSDSQTFANRTIVATNPPSGSTVDVTGKCFWFSTTSQMSVSTMGTVNNAPALPAIASTVRAQPSAGFSIVTWTGQSSGAATVGTGLNAAPEMIIVKARTGSVGWTVGHQSLGWTKRLKLNGSDAESASANYWNNTAPTSSVFTSGANNVNNTFVAYLFAPIAGYSAMGSYVGNASADGPFVFTGFRPRWVMHKRTDTGGASVGDWRIWDTSRDIDNAAEALLFPNGSNAESSNAAHGLDILSNGFKFRTSDTNINANGGTYIYLAFASNPFKTARAR